MKTGQHSESILCSFCKCEIGQLVPGSTGISAAGILDSKSGTRFYPAEPSTRGVCRDCDAKYFHVGQDKHT
jgi:hypothetical protein